MTVLIAVSSWRRSSQAGKKVRGTVPTLLEFVDLQARGRRKLGEEEPASGDRFHLNVFGRSLRQDHRLRCQVHRRRDLLPRNLLFVANGLRRQCLKQCVASRCQ